MPRRVSTLLCLLLCAAAPGLAQTPAGAGQAGSGGLSRPSTPAEPLVEFEMMTWPEVYRAIHERGMTVALVYNGGTEQRGPQNVNGGHTLMGRETVKAIALKLGNAIAAPVMPFSVSDASPALPGTIGVTGATFAKVNEEVAEQLIKNGFKTVVLMGDHGGGQAELRQVAAKLDPVYAPKGVRVYYCDEVYAKAQGDFGAWLDAQGLPSGAHAGLPDTSEMIYLGSDKGWVRPELLPTAEGDPPLRSGERRPPGFTSKNNGITGDARLSTPELGKRAFDIKVDYAVAQIRRLLAAAGAPGAK